ncbi:MAG: polysaccharide biosynthesis tyrosine autokinase [Opitutaceae bacterium]|jgi:capsular exopolysaccharide synthesis family protein|nr:polysaccharide biosynthesis tyrosine autokinase [Opitutaceae bacterium]
MARHDSSSETAALPEFFQVLRQRKFLILLVMAFVVGTAAVVTALLPKWWLSTINIRVEKPDGKVVFENHGNNSYDPYFLQDQFKVIQSPKILNPVIKNLGLNRKIPALLGSPAPWPSDVTYEYLIKKMLRVEMPRNTSLLEVNVFSQDAALAAAIANEIARAYSEDRIAFATAEQRAGLEQLRKELAGQEHAVSVQRDAVEKLRVELNISDMNLVTPQGGDIEIETLRQMQSMLVALRVDAIGRRTRYENFKKIPEADRVNLVNSELITDTNIQNLLQASLVADQSVTRLRSRLGAAHPELITAIDNRAKIREQLDAHLRGYEHGLEISYKEAEARVAELEKQLEEARARQITTSSDRLRPFEEAVRKLDDETRLLSTVKLVLRQREIDFQVPKRTIEILNTAEPARHVARPSWPLNLTFAFLFGGVLGIGAVVLIEFFDASFRGVADVERRLQRPVLGVIPASSTARRPNEDSDNPADLEPFRVLQTNISLARKEAAHGRALVMLSAGPGEGKSTTLLRLARAMGEAGARVLLIDADLRRPTQHYLTGAEKEPGLADLLQGKAALDAVTRRAIAPNLDFIPCGNVKGFTLSLLYAGRLKELLAGLGESYDRILFDAPPIIGVSDASVITSLVDDVLLLVQYRRNPQSMVIRAQQIITSLRKEILGIVLNRVPKNAGDDYSYYTNNYDYSSSRDRRRFRSRRHRPSKSARDDHSDAREIFTEPEK